MAHYCEEEDPAEEDIGESRFEPNILMGLPIEEPEDHWMQDETIATWTRITMAPIWKLDYPGEESPPGVGGLAFPGFGGSFGA